MRACREGGEPYHIGDDLQDRPDETAEPGLDHVSRAYAITAGSNDRFRRASRIRFGAVLTFAEISRGTEFLRITPVADQLTHRGGRSFGEGQHRDRRGKRACVERASKSTRTRLALGALTTQFMARTP